MIEYFLMVIGFMFLMMGYSLWKKRAEIKENFEMYKNMMHSMQKTKK